MVTSRCAASLVLMAMFCAQALALEVDPDASMADADNTLLGLNHVGLSVVDLDATLAFYQQATGYELIARERVEGSAAADSLYGRAEVAYERAILKAPNMLFELTAFASNKDLTPTTMPVQGPGFTHTCFQSSMADPGNERFVAAGATPLSRGGKPVFLGDYGVSYFYAYDPEGNMLELEQLDNEFVKRAGFAPTEPSQSPGLWMSQVALATHDIEALMRFYAKVLGYAPHRRAELTPRKAVDDLGNVDKGHLLGGWFRMNASSKVMEFWQYLNPRTVRADHTAGPTALGYTFSIEVADIQKEYARLTTHGVEFIGKPVLLGQFWRVIARDLDGNYFSLRQASSKSSPLSVRQFDPHARKL